MKEQILLNIAFHTDQIKKTVLNTERAPFFYWQKHEASINYFNADKYHKAGRKTYWHVKYHLHACGRIRDHMQQSNDNQADIL